jgi:hypothetical protein
MHPGRLLRRYKVQVEIWDAIVDRDGDAGWPLDVDVDVGLCCGVVP